VPLHPLDEAGLTEVLLRPKNALVKQYQKLFRMEGVELEFTPEALRAIVRRAQSRGTGARGLRAVMEEIMLPIMFQLPDQQGVQRCIITADTVEHGAEPLYIRTPELGTRLGTSF